MPNVDGLALAKIVRQRWPHIGVVVTSGRPKPSGLPAGARFISKPYRYEDVLHELEAVIGPTRGRNAGQRDRNARPQAASYPRLEQLGDHLRTCRASRLHPRVRQCSGSRAALVLLPKSRVQSMNEFQDNLAGHRPRGPCRSGTWRPSAARRHVRRGGPGDPDADDRHDAMFPATRSSSPTGFTKLSGYARKSFSGRSRTS
jgi:hypothetical protein